MTNEAPLPDTNIIRQAFRCRCPRCGQGALYQDGFMNMNLRDHCDTCQLDYKRIDAADGPAVFLIFILGFMLVPMALLFEWAVHPPLWVHAVLWGIVALGSTLGSLKPLKSFIIALQFKHRPGDWQ